MHDVTLLHLLCRAQCMRAAWGSNIDVAVLCLHLALHVLAEATQCVHGSDNADKLAKLPAVHIVCSDIRT